MQDEDMRSPEQEDRAMDSAVMTLLLDDRFDIWAVAEVERAIGDPVAVADSLRRLRANSLIHQIAPDFVKPSRAALYCNRLELS
jgi:hypothetical protein